MKSFAALAAACLAAGSALAQPQRIWRVRETVPVSRAGTMTLLSPEWPLIPHYEGLRWPHLERVGDALMRLDALLASKAPAAQ